MAQLAGQCGEEPRRDRLDGPSVKGQHAVLQRRGHPGNRRRLPDAARPGDEDDRGSVGAAEQREQSVAFPDAADDAMGDLVA